MRHVAQVSGLSADPAVVNHVYVRSAADPRFTLHLRYRSLPKVEPRFPRTGNLWGWWRFQKQPAEKLARIDLWLGANGMPADRIRELRRLNPQVLVLTSMNAVEAPNLPPDAYLKDIHGHRVEVWPNMFRLNLTKPEVAETQARFAADLIRKNDMMFDGCFFDNVFLSQSWQNHDIYGAPFPIDADGDGKPDDPRELDRRWRAGVLHEIEFFRQLMPDALTCGHALDLDEPVIRTCFNGISIGFQPPNVIEGRMPFQRAFDFYKDWMTRARAPRVTMVESAIPNQIAYGYGYAPHRTVPPSTMKFAQDYYPYMRFGLCFTLLEDGYFTHEIGDTDHGDDWWYDELDYTLGKPRGPAERLGKTGSDLLAEDTFARDIPPRWRLQTDEPHGYKATLTRVTGAAAGRTPAVQVDVAATDKVDWKIELAHFQTVLRKGVGYELKFRARGDHPRSLRLSTQKDKPEWDNYGLDRKVDLTTEWTDFVVPFTSTADARDARVQFLLGGEKGSVWVADVSLRERGPDLYRRDFERGVVFLNATQSPQTVSVGPGLARLKGAQAPLVEYIADDDEPAFETEGSWRTEHLDSGEWKARGPYFHDWGKTCRTSTGPSQSAQWTLRIPVKDTYHVAAWWPAAPEQSWSKKVLYEIVCNGTVAARAEVNQHEGGDQWHAIGEVKAGPGDRVLVRVHALDGAPCVADALHVTSDARYNNGQPTTSVDLAPMDGIILRRVGE